MKLFFRKTVLFGLVAALLLAALPIGGASAARASDTTPQGEVTDERLEQIWARQQRIYERIGKGFDRLDEFTARLQARIDRAEARGRDVTALQTALDAFVQAAKDAQPIYESGRGIISSHQGFDENGKVTDSEKAKETVQAMREKLQELKAAMAGTRKMLREAIRAFREANPRQKPTVTPGG